MLSHFKTLYIELIENNNIIWYDIKKRINVKITGNIDDILLE